MEFARTWGKMKSNRSEQMTYEKMSRAMRLISFLFRVLGKYRLSPLSLWRNYSNGSVWVGGWDALGSGSQIALPQR